jgi:radical SAM superfamily enzyme YgiQ (UPF0313 family)
MKVLLVQPETPLTYWSFQHALPFVGKKTAFPPLGLVSLAGLLPRDWELSLLDLNVESLQDERLLDADVILVTGMLIQSESMRAVLRRARALGKRTVAGGPAVTSSPDVFPEADHLFRGEAEGRLELLIHALENPDAATPRLLSPQGGDRPAMRLAPVPRFDLLEPSHYASMSIQISRGCPFTCEFCDIIELFGRVPRLKSAEQVVAELDALYATGWSGSVFVVDDNFIGNRREVAKLLPHLAAWQARRGQPFDFYTEASVDLASEPKLIEAMSAAGFTAVFLGIETPSSAALAQAGKQQNLKLEPSEAVARLSAAGFEVYAGFIVGFDSDTPDIFDRQREFIRRLPIARAMIGLLCALPGTALSRRLEREGRLRELPSGDQFERPNFIPAMDEEVLLRGYRRLMAETFSAEGYYHQCVLLLDQVALRRRPMRQGSLRALARAVWRIGVRGARRGSFWRLLGRGLMRGPAAASQAVMLAIIGEHMIRYTNEVVLPRIDQALADLAAERAEQAEQSEPRIAVGS